MTKCVRCNDREAMIALDICIVCYNAELQELCDYIEKMLEEDESGDVHQV